MDTIVPQPETPGPTPRRDEASDLLTAVHAALQARDFPAVVAILHRLAVVDPESAQAILDAIHLARR